MKKEDLFDNGLRTTDNGQKVFPFDLLGFLLYSAQV